MNDDIRSAKEITFKNAAGQFVTEGVKLVTRPGAWGLAEVVTTKGTRVLVQNVLAYTPGR